MTELFQSNHAVVRSKNKSFSGRMFRAYLRCMQPNVWKKFALFILFRNFCF